MSEVSIEKKSVIDAKLRMGALIDLSNQYNN